MIGVSFKSDPEMFYEHFNSEAQDLHELTELIEEYQSGYHGYKAWKERRKVDYERQNRIKAEGIWRTLNDYEKVFFIEWFSNKRYSNEWHQLTRSIKSKKSQRS
jgi:hypothetical protein